MDVLELPRPVINFLRTMAKESCRYALSWDIFGGPDSVTLTLTWKLIDEETQSSIINESSSPLSTIKQQQQQQNYDEPPIRTRTTLPKNSNTTTTATSSSPRRSRRDDNPSINENISVPAIFRSSRGKSLEGSSIQSNKQMISPQQHLKEHQHVASLERPTTATPIMNHYHQRSRKGQQKTSTQQSDQIYGNLYETRSASVVKCATISSLSSSSPSPQPTNTNTNNNPPLSAAHTHHQRIRQQQQYQSLTPPVTRKSTRPLVNTSRAPTIPISSSNTSSNYAKLRRTNHIARHDEDDADDDDDTLDPWVKRFECSLEDNDDNTTEHSDDKELLPLPTTTMATTDNLDESTNTSGKVKFKTKPDYF